MFEHSCLRGHMHASSALQALTPLLSCKCSHKGNTDRALFVSDSIRQTRRKENNTCYKVNLSCTLHQLRSMLSSPSPGLDSVEPSTAHESASQQALPLDVLRCMCGAVQQDAATLCSMSMTCVGKQGSCDCNHHQAQVAGVTQLMIWALC